MKITAITKFKHGALWAAIKQLGWPQSELARQCGERPDAIGKIINLQYRPTVKMADTIQRVLGEHGIYFDPTPAWPETFRGLPARITIEQTRELTANEMDDAQTYYNQLEQPQSTEQREAVLEAIEGLGERERVVLEKRFGDEPISLEEVGKCFGVTRERIRQIEKTAIRKLKRVAEKASENHPCYEKPRLV
jgi:RNA polymerase sigma factor (sigma-70 family)